MGVPTLPPVPTMRIARLWSTVAALAALSGSSLFAQVPLPPKAAVARVVDSLATAFIASNASPSVAIAVVRGVDTIALQAWGKADVENGVSATAASVYRIGSVTKQFTSAAVMQLVEQKKVRLDDSIATYLPTLPAAWRMVTVRQLLNHTSGIPSYTGIGAAWRSRWAEEMSPATIASLTADMPMDFAPGTRWKYDNTGYVLLGMLIEKVTGHTWASEIADRFAKPLELTDTRTCANQPAGRDAHGYERTGATWGPAPFLSMSQPYAAGAMCSTIGDLVTWNRALHTGKVVSASSYVMMTTPEGGPATGAKYGFGLSRDSTSGRVIITHGGGINGFITSNVWVPSAELSITVLTNASGARADILLNQIARASLGLPLIEPPRARLITSAERLRFVGVYALMLPDGARDLTFAESGEDLTAQLAGQPAGPLLYYGDNTFGASFDPSVRFIFTVESGRATKVVLVQGGGRFEGLRK